VSVPPPTPLVALTEPVCLNHVFLSIFFQPSPSKLRVSTQTGKLHVTSPETFSPSRRCPISHQTNIFCSFPSASPFDSYLPSKCFFSKPPKIRSSLCPFDCMVFSPIICPSRVLSLQAADSLYWHLLRPPLLKCEDNPGFRRESPLLTPLAKTYPALLFPFCPGSPLTNGCATPFGIPLILCPPRDVRLYDPPRCFL